MDAGMIAARQHSQMNRWRLTCNPTTPRNERGCTQKMQPLDLNGRSGGIRTRDPLLPKQMRYQAALRSDSWHSTLPNRPAPESEAYLSSLVF